MLVIACISKIAETGCVLIIQIMPRRDSRLSQDLDLGDWLLYQCTYHEMGALEKRLGVCLCLCTSINMCRTTQIYFIGILNHVKNCTCICPLGLVKPKRTEIYKSKKVFNNGENATHVYNLVHDNIYSHASLYQYVLVHICHETVSLVCSNSLCVIKTHPVSLFRTLNMKYFLQC